MELGAIKIQILNIQRVEDEECETATFSQKQKPSIIRCGTSQGN